MWVRSSWLLFRLSIYDDDCDLVLDSSVLPPNLHYFGILFITIRVPNSIIASSIFSTSLQRTANTERLIYAGDFLISAFFIIMVKGVSYGPLSETRLVGGFLLHIVHPL